MEVSPSLHITKSLDEDYILQVGHVDNDVINEMPVLRAEVNPGLALVWHFERSVCDGKIMVGAWSCRSFLLTFLTTCL